MTLLINAYSTLIDTTPIAFPHQLNTSRDLTDPELSEHLNGFVGYVVSRGNKEMTQMNYHTIRHIQRVRHHVSLSIDEKDLDALTQWAIESNSILFLPDGTIRDPFGLVLVQPDGGEQDAEAQLPYPADAIERMIRTNETIEKKGLPISKSLPPVIGEREATPRNAQEVALRSLALFIVSVRAESIASNEEVVVEDIKAKRPVPPEAYTPDEIAFLDANRPEEQQVINFVWRYEALNLLLWALQINETLPFPVEICDVPKIAQAMLSLDENTFVKQASLRSPTELLDTLDQHYRLHWAAIEARVNKQKPLSSVDEGVIRERHHALNWLLQFQNTNVNWDDVDTPT